MATSTHKHSPEFHWSAPEFFMALLAGVVAVSGLWLLAGLLMMLFLL